MGEGSKMFRGEKTGNKDQGGESFRIGSWHRPIIDPGRIKEKAMKNLAGNVEAGKGLKRKAGKDPSWKANCSSKSLSIRL